MTLMIVSFVPFLIFGILLQTHYLPMLWEDFESTLFVGIILAAVCAAAIGNVGYWLTLRSTLAGVPRTRERITFMERIRTIAAYTPQGKWTLGFLLVASAVALLGGAFSLFDLLQLKDLIRSLFSIAVGSLAACYFLALFVLKFRDSRRMG
jgi:hypothetical protein